MVLIKAIFHSKSLRPPAGRRLYGAEAAFWFAELFPNIKPSKRPVLPADPSSFQRLSNKMHINIHTCRLPAAPEEVACAPEPPFATRTIKLHGIKFLVHPTLFAARLTGCARISRIFSDSFSLSQSYCYVHRQPIRRYTVLKFNNIFKPLVCQQLTSC